MLEKKIKEPCALSYHCVEHRHTHTPPPSHPHLPTVFPDGGKQSRGLACGLEQKTVRTLGGFGADQRPPDVCKPWLAA